MFLRFGKIIAITFIALDEAKWKIMTLNLKCPYFVSMIPKVSKNAASKELGSVDKYCYMKELLLSYLKRIRTNYQC